MKLGFRGSHHLIRIQIPMDYSACHIKDAHISNAIYFGSHFETELCIDGRKIPLIFGKSRQGGFIYFPQFTEGINISRYQSEMQALEKLFDLFDKGTSAVIMAVVNLFQKLEGDQKWYRADQKITKLIQNQKGAIPF
jgi:hypothetical protein